MPVPETPLPPLPKNESFEIPKKDTVSRWHWLKNWYTSHKKISIPLTFLAVVLILALVPFTRFKIAGLVLSNNFSVKVIDATAGTPVSGATVSSGSISGQTDGSGKVTLHGIKVGQRTISLSKKYYQGRQASVLVPILKQKTTPQIALTATGRQVEVDVANLINKQTLSNVSIEVADITGKTDKDGRALLVLPASLASAKATLSLEGYNDATVTLQISNTSTKKNVYSLTPAGKVYFLSKRTGTLNIMKANLDGSGAETVLAGTGTEQANQTALSQSPDGKYVALVTQRSSGDPGPQMYVLSTQDDKLLTIDTGNAVFLLQGWAGDSLVYTVQRQDMQAWQAGRNKLKSYDASTGKTTLLDQSLADGDSTASVNEYYAETIAYGSSIIYAKSWTRTDGSASAASLLTGKQNTLAIIDAGGQNHKVVATYDAADSIQYIQHGPNGLYIWDQSAGGSTKDQFFDYTFGSAAAKQISSMTSDQFYQSGQTFYYSASGKQALWSENRDGKNAIIVSDNMGGNPQTIASLASYNAYGWFGEQYVLLSLSNSQLYVLGLKGENPIKISDYQFTSIF